MATMTKKIDVTFHGIDERGRAIILVDGQKVRVPPYKTMELDIS